MLIFLYLHYIPLTVTLLYKIQEWTIQNRSLIQIFYKEQDWFLNSYVNLRYLVLKKKILHRKKIFLEARSRVAIMLNLCLNFEDFYPKYAYKRYAYKKKLVYLCLRNHFEGQIVPNFQTLPKARWYTYTVSMDKD